MQANFIQFSYEDVTVLPGGCSLLLNIDERIVTLLGAGGIQAQCRCSPSAFRLLFFLLQAPHGADYAELLACLRCSESVFRKLFASSSREQILATLAPQVDRWHRHLEKSALHGKSALEKELKMIRRATKERSGVNAILKKHGFALTVRAMYRKGYLLTSTPLLQ
ncbi:MAG TPA: hypothetical protein VKR06_08435 [Ktedonosporobacter sp.]|nr:hypothetical protein [Ktedonosporobacter sp.]